MSAHADTKSLPKALSLLSSERPRNVNWFQAGALLFGDWGTSRLYVLGLAFLVAGQSSFWLVAAMSVLILIVGWAYTQICRIYADGGGVYTAGKHRAAILGVVGALLLFADYTVTASLSSLDGFHYFGLSDPKPEHVQGAPAEKPKSPEKAKWEAEVAKNPGVVVLPVEEAEEHSGGQFSWKSPALWAVVSIVAIGALNLLGPKHSAGFALISAVGMVIITMLIVVFAIPQIKWSQVDWSRLNGQPVGHIWHGFVYIVLALSGVEAIANLTGVMKRPVYKTAQRSIWFVAFEVAIFNLFLALAMISLIGVGREDHKEDMLAFMARYYIGNIGGFYWGEWAVRIIGGLLLLSATNTAIGALTGTIYVMSRDGELPRVFQKLNAFGTPWLAAVVATVVPSLVLVLVPDFQALASMYAIGVVGAVAINCCITTFHPRLRKWYRKAGMLAIGLFLLGIWVTLAVTKLHATLFVAIVMVVGLSLRWLTKVAQNRRPKPSLLRQAIYEQLPEGAMFRPKVLLATAGSDAMAGPALEYAKEKGATLVVSFIREVALNFKVEAENRMSLETDTAAQALFVDFLEHGHKAGVPIIPAYDTSQNAPEQIAELAAMYGVDKVLIGSSRRGAIHQFIKGNFQKKLESMLEPAGISVKVLQLNEKPQAADSAAVEPAPAEVRTHA